jgi:hypothetical protein
MENIHLKLQQTTSGFEEMNKEYERMQGIGQVQSKLLVELLLLRQTDQAEVGGLEEDGRQVEEEFEKEE